MLLKRIWGLGFWDDWRVDFGIWCRGDSGVGVFGFGDEDDLRGVEFRVWGLEVVVCGVKESWKNKRFFI